MEHKEKMWVFAMIFLALFIGGYAGFELKDNIIFDDIVESENYCKDQNQVLRLSIWNGKTYAECFGELPEVDLKVGWTK